MRLPFLYCLLTLVLFSFGETYSPLRVGVVFFPPDTPEQAIAELEKIKSEGFNQIEYASWVWTLPKPGSKIEEIAETVLNWCDKNSFHFTLIHNIQYGSAGEGGTLDEIWENPSRVFPYLEDWVRVLKGHPSVDGIILGNEVSPTMGTPLTAPKLWQGFRQYLREIYKDDISKLNLNWGTNYKEFADIGIPPEGSGGNVDLRRFSYFAFARFYNYIVREYLRPQLGDKEFSSKTLLDPFLQRELREYNIANWDDLLADFPLWRIKAVADTVKKPLYNSELHLYHDDYNYGSNEYIGRYRYFMSALLGEYATSSFSWGGWNKPETKRIHKETLKAIKDLFRLEKYQRALHSLKPQIGVLLTETNFYIPHFPDSEAKHPLALLYAYLGTTGVAWSYILEDDLTEFRLPYLIVWSKGLKRETAEKLIALPRSIRIFYIEKAPEFDEYGSPLPTDIKEKLKKRGIVISSPEKICDFLPFNKGKGPYGEVVEVPYLWWSPERGHFTYKVPYAKLEVKRMKLQKGELLCIINNTKEEISAPLPVNKHNIWNLVKEEKVENTSSYKFHPLEVTLFLVD
ncbi:beta-galactosidase [bacterium]|nr:beta-galactosidase [bacterium]